MESETKHSPLPWRQVSKDGRVGVDIRAASGRAVAATFGVANQPRSVAGMRAQAEEDRANAALIVSAVNSSQAAQGLATALEDFIDSGTDGRPVPEWVLERIEQARAALKAWEDKKS